MNHFGRVLEGKMASCGVGFRGDEVCNCFGEDFLGFSGELEHHLFFSRKNYALEAIRNAQTVLTLFSVERT